MEGIWAELEEINITHLRSKLSVLSYSSESESEPGDSVDEIPKFWCCAACEGPWLPLVWASGFATGSLLGIGSGDDCFRLTMKEKNTYATRTQYQWMSTTDPSPSPYTTNTNTEGKGMSTYLVTLIASLMDRS